MNIIEIQNNMYMAFHMLKYAPKTVLLIDEYSQVVQQQMHSPSHYGKWIASGMV